MKRCLHLGKIQPEISALNYIKVFSIIRAVARNTFTVVNDPFTAGNWRGTCEPMITRKFST